MTALTVLLLVPVLCQETSTAAFSETSRSAALDVTVRIVNKTTGSTGSGVLVNRSGPFVYILTAGHVVGRDDTAEVSTYSATSRPKTEKVYEKAEVLARSDTPDLAILRLRTTDAMPRIAAICLPRQVPEGKAFLALACSAGTTAGPRSLGQEIQAKRKAVKPGERDSAWYWVTEKGPARGESGGPLLDRGNRVIGIASGLGDGKGFYTHAEEIHGFLKRNGLRWIYEESPARP